MKPQPVYIEPEQPKQEAAKGGAAAAAPLAALGGDQQVVCLDWIYAAWSRHMRGLALTGRNLSDC